MDIPLSAATLAKPTPELVRPVYETAITTLMGITREEQQQPVFMAIDALDFPELHDESIPHMAFLKNCTRLLAAAGVRDFNMQDMSKPESGRLRRNMSALVNLAKFREEKLIDYVEGQKTAEELQQRIWELEDQKKALATHLSQLQEDRASQHQEAAEVRGAWKEVADENRNLNRQQHALSEEAGRLKERCDTLKQAIGKVDLDLAEANVEAKKLSAEIVEPPEQLQERMQAMAAAIKQEEALQVDALHRQRLMEKRLQEIGKVDRHVGEALEAMRELEKHISQKKENKAKVRTLEAEIRGVKEECDKLLSQQRHLQSKLHALEEELGRIHSKWEVKKEAALSRIVEQRMNKEAVEAENAANNAKLAEHLVHGRKLRKSIADMQSSHEAQVNAVMDKYNSLRTKVAEYHEALKEAMGMGSVAVGVKALHIR
ncbi:g795 [Coccomyxa viridis]|uniref:G795 protein n=1 Tax=Coccomyxa viridis TaxID=1274662 RepID=A0ABP1FJH7_9CHLO